MNIIKQNRSFPTSLIKYIFLGLCATIFLTLGYGMFALAQENTEEKSIIDEPKDLYARSAVLMDADSGRILFDKNGSEELPMASTTKIMTCILALENADLDEVVTASDYASTQPAVRLGVKEGQQFVLRDLLYSLMLESHNDSAVIIAEFLGKTVEGFADLMNEKAQSIGCINTYFITPNGLDAEDENGIHHTTAAELAKIMKYCIMDSPKKDLFLKITQTQSYQFSDISGNSVYNCTNHNLFLQMMEGALSGKTGFTNDAGYCYVGALENKDRTFIVALLACGWPNNKGYKWVDTRKLMKYGIEHFHYQNIYQYIQLPDLTVKNGLPDQNQLGNISTIGITINMPLAVLESGELQVLLRDDETVNTEIDIVKFLQAPVAAGSEVGTVRYLLNKQEIYTYKIVTSELKKDINLNWCILQVLKRFFCY